MQLTQKDLLDQLNCQSFVVINHAELQNFMIFISNYKKRCKEFLRPLINCAGRMPRRDSIQKAIGKLEKSFI